MTAAPRGVCLNRWQRFKWLRRTPKEEEPGKKEEALVKRL
jgi:hypothetical protein